MNIVQGLNKAEKQDTPDSTTKFFEGEEVFVQINDQFILGKIKEIDVAAERCLVNIDSGEAVWAPFKDLRTWTIDIEESPVKCNLCKGTHSRKNNLVITCEVCFRGYHQKCYEPIIESVDYWRCQKCSKKEAFKGQKVCIKSASPRFHDERRRTTSKVKKKFIPSEQKVPCMDFGDVSPPIHLGTCSLGELSPSKETPEITLPLALNHVIVDPLIRPTKRHLSEKDIKIVNGVVKKRRRFRRLSNVGIRPIDPVLPSASSQLNKVGIHPTSIKPTVPNGSSADLKTLVYRYLNDENKRVTENDMVHRFTGEEYRVCGKRQTLDGRVEYLVEWVKCTDPL